MTSPAPLAPLEVRFTSSLLELAAVNRAMAGASRAGRILRACVWGAGLLVVVLGAAGVLTSVGVIYGLTFVVLYLVLLWLIPLQTAFLIRLKSPGQRGESVMRLGADGIWAGSALSEVYIDWAGIVRTLEQRRFIILFTSSQSGCYLPKRVLSDAELEAARAWLAACAGKPGVVDAAAAARRTADQVEVEARFEMDAEELARTGMAAARNSRVVLFWIALLLLMNFWTVGPRAVAQWQAGGVAAVQWKQVLWAAFPIVLVLGLGRLASSWASRRILRTGAITGGTQVVGLGPWGVRASGPLHTGRWQWAAFSKATEDAEFFYLYVSSIQPVFIPKRVLDEPARARVREVARAALGARATMAALAIVVAFAGVNA
jgi:hypothetical protein